MYFSFPPFCLFHYTCHLEQYYPHFIQNSNPNPGQTYKATFNKTIVKRCHKSSTSIWILIPVKDEVLFLCPLSERVVSHGLYHHPEVHPQSYVGSWSFRPQTGWGRLPPTPPLEHWSAQWMVPRHRQQSYLQCPHCWCPHRTTCHPTVRWGRGRQF